MPIKPFIAQLTLVAFFLTFITPLPNAHAQMAFDLPAPGTMVDFSPKFNQARLQGIIFHPEDPFKFDFILDEGDAPLNQAQSSAQSRKIAMYFLASLTTPEKEIWVNLSPYEKNRIVPESFGQTLMGQNLLAQDYMLKQIMATALYPERQLGREFWQKVYQKAREEFGTTNVPIDTFNKVWIVPDRAVVYENAKMNAVFVAESSLKVMLEKDYLAQTKHQAIGPAPAVMASVASTMSSAVIKELVIPALEKEVNEGKNFAPLRQVYNALILAKWYKDNLRDNILARAYVDRNKITGVDSQQKQWVAQIYEQYLKAYKKGVFNFIKEEYDEASQSTVPRKYFSGGIMGKVDWSMTTTPPRLAWGRMLLASISLTVATTAFSGSQALAQQLQDRQVLEALGGGPTVVTSNLSFDQEKGYLKIIREAANGQGDPQAAANDLDQINDISALDEVAKIMRLSPPGKLPKDLFSNSSGPSITDGIFPLAQGTQLGIVESIFETFRWWHERHNVGSSRLREAAVRYVWRMALAGKIVGGSGTWQKLTKTGLVESLMSEDPDPEVMAMRFQTLAALFRAGVPSTELFGQAHVGLGLVEKGLLSPYTIVRYSALTVLASIPGDSFDNRYQAIIERFLQQPVDKNTDIVMYHTMVRVAIEHHLTTVLSSILTNLDSFAKLRPSGPVELNNWHANMSIFMRQVLDLCKRRDGTFDKDLLISNLDLMYDSLTREGATDFINSLYLGLLFDAVQARYLNGDDFNAQLRKLQLGGGVAIGPSAPDMVRRALSELRNGVNVTANVEIITEQGGPMYFPDLLAVFGETNDLPTVKAILGQLDRILSMGIYPHINAWTKEINKKASLDNPYVALRDWVVAYAQNHVIPGNALSYALADTNNLAGMRRVLNGFISVGPSSANDYTSAILQAIYKFPNPNLDATKIGQREAFNGLLALAAQAIANTDNVENLINDNAPPNEGGTITRNQLRAGVKAVMAGSDALAAIGEAVPQGLYAKTTIEDYLLNRKGVTVQAAATAIDQAYEAYIDPSNPNSGQMLIGDLMSRVSNDGTYQNASVLLRLADLFDHLQDKNRGFLLLGGLLGGVSGPHYLQVDEHVLDFFARASAQQIARSKSKIVGTAIYWLRFGLDQKNRAYNADAINIVDTMTAKLRAIGTVNLRDELSANLPRVESEDEHSILWGLMASSPKTGRTVSRQTTGPEPLGVTAPRENGFHSSGFSITALHDLNRDLNLPQYRQGKNLTELFNKIASLHKQMGSITIPAEEYQSMAELYFSKFQEAEVQDKETVIAAFDLFLSMRPGTAGDLVWKGLSALGAKYPNISTDEGQREDFFKVLEITSQGIRALSQINPAKYKDIVVQMRNNLSRTNKFDHGLLYAFLLSIDTSSDTNTALAHLGIQSASDNPLSRIPEKPWNTNFTGAKKVYDSYTDLTVKIAKIKTEIANIPSKGFWGEVKALYDPSNAEAQMSAINHLGGLALLFPNLSLDGDGMTFYLYNALQYEIQGNYPRLLPDMNGLSQEDRMLAEGILARRGPQGWHLMERELNTALLVQNPGALNEAVYWIGQRGRPEMLEPLLRFYFDNNLTGTTFMGHGRKNLNYLGAKVEEAIIKMGKRYPSVKSALRDLGNRLRFGNGGYLIEQLIRDIDDGNKAMLHPANGGIDLGNLTVQSSRRGEVKTAFDDPAQLAILIKAQGLMPVIEGIRPLTQATINQLLGT